MHWGKVEEKTRLNWPSIKIEFQAGLKLWVITCFQLSYFQSYVLSL